MYKVQYCSAVLGTYIYSSKTVMGENFCQNTAQLGNILYGATFFPFKYGAVALI